MDAYDMKMLQGDGEKFMLFATFVRCFLRSII